MIYYCLTVLSARSAQAHRQDSCRWHCDGQRYWIQSSHGSDSHLAPKNDQQQQRGV